MKSILLIIFFAINFLNTVAQNVAIPDTNFKAVLLANGLLNVNADAEIQLSEANGYAGTLDVSGHGIYDLTGIEAFVSLQNLYCSSNNLTTLDLSANINLKSLRCGANQLTSLNLTSNFNLLGLECGFNQLTILNLNASYNLSYLRCNDNQLADLNLSGKNSLEYLSCENNYLSNLNITGDTALTFLECYGNQLTSLDVSTNISLDHLNLQFNNVTSLDVSNNLVLTYLDCHNNSLTYLNVTGATSLYQLYCANNQLTDLDVSTNAALTFFAISFNQLTELDASGNSAIIYLEAGYNRLVNLNFRNGNNTVVYDFSSLGNPDLDCIQVDNANYSDTAYGWRKDPAASYNSNCTSGIGSASNVNSSLIIYPNPTHDAITIETEINPENVSIEIIDRLGKTVYFTGFSGKQLVINKIFKPGIYFVRINNSKTSLVKKLILE